MYLQSLTYTYLLTPYLLTFHLSLLISINLKIKMRKLQELNRFDFVYSNNYIIWHMFNLKWKECGVCHLQSTNKLMTTIISDLFNKQKKISGRLPVRRFDARSISVNLKEFGLRDWNDHDNQFFQHKMAAAGFENMFLVVSGTSPLGVQKMASIGPQEKSFKNRVRTKFCFRLGSRFSRDSLIRKVLGCCSAAAIICGEVLRTYCLKAENMCEEQ